MTAAAVIFSDLGEAGLLCEHPPGPLDLMRQRRIWAVARALTGTAGLCELVPGMNNLLVLFDPLACDPEDLRARISALWQAPVPMADAGRLVEVPVVYGGDGGPDLAALADRAGLDPVAFAQAHAGADYTVYALGAQPGFGYLGGLPDRLATPRRAVIHPRVPAGSVIIGGAQTAVQAATTPSGWHMIGRTELRCFDPGADPPALLAPGDRVRFRILEVLA